MKKKLIISFMILLSVFYSFPNPPVGDGKLIFTSRCAGCHNVNKVVAGPALAGVDQRRSMDWIIKFVHSSQTVIKGGDKEAVALYEKFNKIPMPDHPDLTVDNIKNILVYIKSETKTTTDDVVFIPKKIHPAYIPLSINNYGFFISYIGLVFLLMGALLAFVKVKDIQRRSKNDIE